MAVRPRLPGSPAIVAQPGAKLQLTGRVVLSLAAQELLAGSVTRGSE